MGGVSEAKRLPQSERSPTSPSTQVEMLTEDGRHCGTEVGIQGSKRPLEVSPRSGGPGGGLQDSPKDWCITATDATARATLLTYAMANRQDNCRREGKKAPGCLLSLTHTPLFSKTNFPSLIYSQAPFPEPFSVLLYNTYPPAHSRFLSFLTPPHLNQPLAEGAQGQLPGRLLQQHTQVCVGVPAPPSTLLLSHTGGKEEEKQSLQLM